LRLLLLLPLLVLLGLPSAFTGVASGAAAVPALLLLLLLLLLLPLWPCLPPSLTCCSPLLLFFKLLHTCLWPAFQYALLHSALHSRTALQPLHTAAAAAAVWPPHCRQAISGACRAIVAEHTAEE
jgi:hypothetical protein